MSKHIWTDGENQIEYQISYGDGQENVKIIDAYLIKGDAVKIAFVEALKADGVLSSRAIESLLREWNAHNVMYKWGICKGKTKDTDLNSNESAIRRLAYYIITKFFKD